LGFNGDHIQNTAFPLAKYVVRPIYSPSPFEAIFARDLKRNMRNVFEDGEDGPKLKVY
jgi:hypothetical protein